MTRSPTWWTRTALGKRVSPSPQPTPSTLAEWEAARIAADLRAAAIWSLS